MSDYQLDVNFKTFPILYKQSSTGKTSQWSIECTNSTKYSTFTTPYYTIRHGYVGMAMVEKVTYVLEGKNIGKANETSPWEQCKLEAESKWTKQRDRKGYSENIKQEKQLRPMLAKSYNQPGSDLTKLKDGHHILFPCLYQPKLDGLRCLAIKENGRVRLMSRQGKPFTVLQHIEEDLNKVMKDGDIFDGELYNPDINFQEIVSAIKRDKKSDKTALIQYHIYDMVSDQNFYVRTTSLSFAFAPIKDTGSLRLVPTVLLEKPEDLRLIHDALVAEGYEGVILRNLNGPYEIDKRSKNLQKVKAFDEEEFLIINAFENTKMPGTCTFVCQTEDGNEFSCMPEGDENLRREYWKHWKNGKIYEGMRLTVRFFGWTTSEESVPRFPIGKSIRNYE